MDQSWDNISTAACAVLNCEKASEKAATARAVAAQWRSGELLHAFTDKPSERPARPPLPKLLAPSEMPRRRKAGNDSNRRALLHAVAHIELNAIDLAFDIIARFGNIMPKGFTDDWIGVGDDEARHFSLLNSRLKAVQSFYGDLPAHDGLWQSAMDTAKNLPARLAVVPMVLEARGLDVTPAMIKQFENVGDPLSAEVLQTIYEDEIGHVRVGSQWFKFLADKVSKDPEIWFQELVRKYFHGHLKPPFNTAARSNAGLPSEYYEPLAAKKNTAKPKA